MDKNKGKHEMGDSIITKMRLIREVNNDMCHNYYYEVNWRVYTDATHFYRGNFVIWFDVFDVADYYPDKERFSKKDIREYAEEIACNFLCGAPKKEVNAETIRPFYNQCRETINNYNGSNAA